MEQKSIQQKNEDFYRIVEAGDIALFNYIEEAIYLLGCTKVGKTSSCHLLCDSPLRSESINGELVYRPSSTKYKAKVGNLVDSETQIPNIFRTIVRDPKTNTLKQTVVMDQPGYGDTYGFHRMFSNGYFHYRSFSKTGKIKFVLTFSQTDLLASAASFKYTIFNFINIFKNYQAIKDKVLAATSFLITKAEKPLNNTEALKNKLIFLRQNATKSMGNTQKENFQSIITEIVTNNKVYFIEKPTQAGSCTTQSKILQQIYFNSQFWERPLKQKTNNLVSMQNINFSVATQVIKNLNNNNFSNNSELFTEDFYHFLKYTQSRVDSFISTHEGSLQKIVNQLTLDAQVGNYSTRILEMMENFNNKYYKFDLSYNKERKQRQIDLFRSQQADSFSSSKTIEQDSPKRSKDDQNTYFIRMFKVLQQLQKLCKQKLQDLRWVHNGRTIESIEQTSYMFRKIFRKVSLLGIKKEHQEIIYRYSYIIQRLIQENKIITLILFSDSKASAYFANFDNNIHAFSEDLFRKIADRFITQTVGQINVRKLKWSFVAKFDFDSLSNISDQVIDFFQDLISRQKNSESSMMIQQSLKLQSYANIDQSFDYQTAQRQAILKIAQLFKRYYKLNIQTEVPPSKQLKIKVAKKLYQYRSRIFSYLTETTQVTTKKQMISHTFNLTKLLAKIFMSLEKLKEAKECYISINDARSLFQIYEKEYKLVQSRQQQQRIQLLKYGKVALKYDRKDLAKECFQKAYSLSEDCDQINEISNLITQTEQQKEQQSQRVSSYIDNLSLGKYCLDLTITDWS